MPAKGTAIQDRVTAGTFGVVMELLAFHRGWELKGPHLAFLTMTFPCFLLQLQGLLGAARVYRGWKVHQKWESIMQLPWGHAWCWVFVAMQLPWGQPHSCETHETHSAMLMQCYWNPNNSGGPSMWTLGGIFTVVAAVSGVIDVRSYFLGKVNATNVYRGPSMSWDRAECKNTKYCSPSLSGKVADTNVSYHVSKTLNLGS